MSKKIVQHIPTQTCWYTEEDGETVVISGCYIKPKIDGEVFWKYVDKFVEKEIVPVDPTAEHRTIKN